MFNSNDLLEMLRNGKTMDEIAASMSDALNAAEKDYKAEVEAEQKLAESAKKKVEDFEALMEAALDFYLEYYCPEEDKASWLDTYAEVDPAEILKEVEEGIAMANKLDASVKDVLSVLTGGKEAASAVIKPDKNTTIKMSAKNTTGKPMAAPKWVSADEVINDFFRKMKL